MPGGTGFDMLKSLPLRTFKVIFVTAYDQYAIQAIKVSAVDYLLKPINSEDLKQAVKKTTEKINGRKQNHPLENLVNFYKTNIIKKNIALPYQPSKKRGLLL